MGDDLAMFLQEIAEVEQKISAGEIPLEEPHEKAVVIEEVVKQADDGKIYITDKPVHSRPIDDQNGSNNDDSTHPPPAKRPAFGFAPRSVASKVIAKAAVITKPPVLSGVAANGSGMADTSIEPYPGAFGGSTGPSLPALLPTPATAAAAKLTATPAATTTTTTSVPAAGTVSGHKRKTVRTCGGEVWEDPTLLEWPENDFRLFVGDLGNEVTDDILAEPFRKYITFAKAKVVRDKKTHKSKGYGFVSFTEAMDALNALKEMNGEYIGNRPIKLRRSTWAEKSITEVRKKDRDMNKRLGIA